VSPICVGNELQQQTVGVFMMEQRSITRDSGGPWSLGAGGKQGGAPQQPAQQQAAPIQLTRHEKRNFVGQTVHLAGSAFIDCTFDSCTLVLTGSPFVFQGQCRVQRCNWRIEYDILWGAPATRMQLRAILDQMEAVAEQPPAV
jgi:hypothetical protein